MTIMLLTTKPDQPREFRRDREVEKPVQRLRATVEPFSHVSVPQEKSRSHHTVSAYVSKEGTHLAIKEQVNSSRLAQSSDRTPTIERHLMKPVFLDLETSLQRKGGSADSVGSVYPDLVHSNSIAPQSPGPAQELTPIQHNHDAEKKSLEHQQCSTPIRRESLKQSGTLGHKESDLAKCSKLESQVQVQADVNKELKRLLVASIGNDLQHRVSQIVQDKATTSHRLDRSLQQLTENEEEMDRLNIECDIWRSKFLASRLMIDELATWKADVVRKLRESQRALQQLLQEHLELKRVLHASGCCDGRSNHPNSSEWPSSLRGKTVLDLAKDLSVRGMTMMAQDNVSDSCAGMGLVEQQLMPTSGEVMALQVLSNGGQPSKVYSSKSLPLPLKLSKDQHTMQSKSKSSSPQSHPSFHYLLGTESHSIQFHCSRCKGKIYHV